MGDLLQYDRLAITGRGPGAEIWQTSIGLVAVGSGPGTQAALQAQANMIEPLVNTWWTSVKTKVDPSYSYTGISIYQYIAPVTVAQLQARVDRTAVPGTLANGGCPIDTAMVHTLGTGIPGRSTRGRMYVPYHDACVVGTGLWPTAQPATWAGFLKTLLNGITGGSAFVPVVISRTHGTQNPITSIKVDNKPDVQRRRENRLNASATAVVSVP